VTRNIRAQAFVENLFNTRYYVTAHNNNNISPGSRRAVRVSLASGF
jgi:catecholate siderophore receptor